MTFSSDKFRNNLMFHGGPAPVNRYEVYIPRRGGQHSSLTLRCEQAELPGKTILTVEDKLYGPVRKIGYGQMFIENQDELYSELSIQSSEKALSINKDLE